MRDNGNDFDTKLLQLLNNNEIDLKILVEFLERCQLNLMAVRKNLAQQESTTLITGSDFLNFYDLLKRILTEHQKEAKRFIRDNLKPDEKFELMIQNAEKFAWLLELEKRKQR